MTRIRFIGSFASGKPLSPGGLPVVGRNIIHARRVARPHRHLGLLRTSLERLEALAFLKKALAAVDLL
jgi:hypothetical protein